MQRLSAALLLLLFGLGSPVSSPRSFAPDTSHFDSAAVELEISGPRQIRAGDDLKFQAFIVNHSSRIIALPSSSSSAIWSGWWKITDAFGRTLPTPPPELICGTHFQPPIADKDVIFVLPGQRAEIKDVGDPSIFFIFPGKGSYRVSLTVGFVTPRIWRTSGGGTAYSGLSPDSTISGGKLDELLHAPSINVTSQTWTMYLTD
jgi:hypothetical protein